MDILRKITEMRLEKGWTEYELAERADLTQSTISSWYRKNLVPSIPSLEHICCAYGITLSQFFVEKECHTMQLSQEQIEVLKRWNKMNKDQQKKLSEFIDSVI